MVGFDDCVAKLWRIGKALRDRQEDIVQAMATDVGMTRRDCEKDLAFVSAILGSMEQTRPYLSNRSPICKEGEEVALVLSYNISNFTSLHLARLLIPGNRVRVRLSSQAPQVARLLQEIWLPVFPRDVIFDFRPSGEFIKWCFSQRSVRTIILFASDAAAFSYEPDMRESSNKTFIFEGPGNDPFIVLPDCDHEKAALALASAKSVYSGQACWSPERIFVHDAVYDAFLQEFVRATRSYVVGDPLDPETIVGPVANASAARRIKTQLDDAIRKGGRVLTGGETNGFLIQPIIVDQATPDMIGTTNETFGPMCFVQRFASTDEVIEMARNDKYGLHMTVWGWGDVGKIVCELMGENCLHEVEDFVFGKFGMLTVNSELPFPGRVFKPKVSARPFGLGGYGYSGWVWEAMDGRLILKQGPRSFDMETSVSAEKVEKTRSIGVKDEKEQLS